MRNSEKAVVQKGCDGGPFNHYVIFTLTNKKMDLRKIIEVNIIIITPKIAFFSIINV